VTGCGETSKPKAPAPVNPPMNTGTPPTDEPAGSQVPEGEEMPTKEGDEPAADEKSGDTDTTDKDAPADDNK